MQQHIGEGEALWPVDDEAHGPGIRMRADVDDGARKIAVFHARHGDEELAIEEATFPSVLQRQ
jgi:hypothetical protein